MKKRLLFLLIACSFLLGPLGFGQNEFAYILNQPPARDEDILSKKISVDFRNIDVIEALRFLSLRAGMNIVPTQKVEGRVSLAVESAQVKDIFDIMLRSNGLAYQKRGRIYNVMTEEEYENFFGEEFGDNRVTRSFRLKYAVPEQVFNLCNNLASRIGKVFLDTDSATILVIDVPSRVAEMEKMVKSLEEEKTVVNVYSLQYADAEDVSRQLENQLDMKNVGSIRPDTRNNQVVVEALPGRINRIERLIKSLDVKTREVLVDVKIVRVDFDDSFERSVEWEGIFGMAKDAGLAYLGSYPFSLVSDEGIWKSRKEVYEGVGYPGSYPFSGTTRDIAGGSRVFGSEKMHLGMIGSHDFDVALKYLKTLGEVRMMSNPKLTVVNNTEARVHIGEKQAYLTETTTATEATTTIAESVHYVDTGIKLYVTPFINEEGFVTLRIKPEISTIISFLETSAGNRIPIINTSTTETTVMVRDGFTVLIGGLKKEESYRTKKEVPFFSRIPLLGNLFTSESRAGGNSEIIILVTPHITTGQELVKDIKPPRAKTFSDERRDYQLFSQELVEERISPRTYRDYPGYKDESELEYRPGPRR